MTEVEMVAGTMQPITNRITAQNFIFDTDNKNALFFMNFIGVFEQASFYFCHSSSGWLKSKFPTVSLSRKSMLNISYFGIEICQG